MPQIWVHSVATRVSKGHGVVQARAVAEDLVWVCCHNTGVVCVEDHGIHYYQGLQKCLGSRLVSEDCTTAYTEPEL